MPRAIRRAALVAGTLAGLFLIASGCTTANRSTPVLSDGYTVNRHPGVEMVWVESLGAYRVSGHPTVYYQGGRYYRDRGGYWETSSSLKGRWKKAHPHGMPPGLAKKQHQRDKAKKR